MHTHTEQAAVAFEGVSRTYGSGPAAVAALNDLSISFDAHAFTAVMGPSGSGKSTLLQIAAGLDSPNSGSVRLGDRELTGLSETERTILRRDQVGFVFQAYNLMPTLTVAQNVELPLRLAGRRPDRAATRDILDRVGLGKQHARRPNQLSGGQRQRVAIARALVVDPAVTLADEPTGAHDTAVAAEILALLAETVASGGQTVVMVTHDPTAAAHADRVVFLADGQVAGEMRAPTVESVTAVMADLAPVVA